MFTKKDKRAVSKVCERIVSDAFRVYEPVAVSCGSSPVGGGYPCAALEVSFHIGAHFPAGVSDLAEAGDTAVERLRPHVERWDDAARKTLERLGVAGFRPNERLGDEHGIVPAVCFPPMGWTDRDGMAHDQFALHYYRPLTPEELSSYRFEHGCEPFTDEAFVCVRYSGINIFRVATAHYETFSRYGFPGSTELLAVANEHRNDTPF